MAIYIALIDFTDQGLKTIKDSPARAEAFTDRAKALGAKVKDLYWTSGPHDGVLTFEAANDATASSLLLALAQSGNVRTHMLRAYDRSEMENILSRLD